MSTIIDGLVYDRTQADVDRVQALKARILEGGLSALTAAEQAEWLAGMKGAYNHGDMARVGQAVAYLAGRLAAVPGELAAYRAARAVDSGAAYEVPYDPADVVVTAKTDWAMGDAPTQGQAAAYLEDLRVLRRQLGLPAGAPAVPDTLDRLGWASANDMERLLVMIDGALRTMEAERYDRIDRTVVGFAHTGICDCGG